MMDAWCIDGLLDVHTVLIIVGPPGLPVAMYNFPPVTTNIGVIADNGRLFGAMEFASPSRRAFVGALQTREIPTRRLWAIERIYGNNE